MKIKYRKKYGMYQIVVDDSTINKMYDRTQKEPVVLANLSHYDKTGFWKLEDIRLLRSASGYSSLNHSTTQCINIKNEAEQELLTSSLHHYLIKEEQNKKYIVWSTYNGIVMDGDKIADVFNTILVPKTLEYCWSLQAAKEKLEELYVYWEQYQQSHLDNISIPNKSSQMSELESMIMIDNATRKKRISIK